MGDAFARLEAEYCPPLDPALFSAIALDYDLKDEDNVREARATLDLLKESAAVEEAAGFDPSGTGAQDENATSEKRAASSPETDTSQSQETELSSLSNGVSSLNLDDVLANGSQTPIGDAEELEKLDEETKIRLLRDLFGEYVSKYSIQHTLRKCNGRWQAAMEELLNHVYFDHAENSDDGGKVAAKGVEAFSEDNIARRGRKGKAKRQRLKGLDDVRSSSLPSSPAESPAPSVNKWKTSAEDIEFIASRTRIASATVSSMYYENRASIPRTIGALLKASMEESKAVVTDDATVSANARELGNDFPTIASDYLATLIRLTHPSTSAAHELAKALTSKPKEANGGGLKVIPQYAPLQPDDLITSLPRKNGSRSSHGSQSPPFDPLTNASRASSYATARATAFSQASAAHRKARSDRLMGGAAAYYGQVGRENAALYSAASAAAADALAASQSTPTQLDLHGIDVLNAVRIAQERVESWWSGLGESRVNGRVGAGDRAQGFRIVVGLGRHSEGGKGKLGPAVTKMLGRDGWKMEVGGGVIVVKGRAR